MSDDIPPALPGPILIDPSSGRREPLSHDPGDFQSALPVQTDRLIFEDEEIGLAVGIWDTTTMQETFGPYPGDAFITVPDGRFSFVDEPGKTLATAGTGGWMGPPSFGRRRAKPANGVAQTPSTRAKAMTSPEFRSP